MKADGIFISVLVKRLRLRPAAWLLSFWRDVRWDSAAAGTIEPVSLMFRPRHFHFTIFSKTANFFISFLFYDCRRTLVLEWVRIRSVVLPNNISRIGLCP